MKKLLAVLLTVLLLVQPISLSVSAFSFNDGTLVWPEICETHTYDHGCDPTCNKCGLGREVEHLIYGPACSNRVCTRCNEVVVGDGSHTYTNACDTHCNLCNAVREVAPHTYVGQVTTPATCGAQGVRTYTCTACGDSYTETIPATAEHVYDMVVTDPTCEEKGNTVYICTDCGYKYTINIPATGHKYVTTVEEPRCDREGYDLHTCTVCGYSYKDNFTPMRTEHAYWSSYTFYSCTEPCYDVYSCFYCNDSYLEYFAPTGHSPWTWPTMWPCQQYVLCENYWCNEIITPATGHLYTDEVERQEPTCEEDGYIIYCCYGCPTYKKETIPATGHTYTDACDDACDDCGATRIAPHQYTDPYDTACDLCGALREVNAFRVGDVNGDGKINVRDLGLLQQYLNHWDVSVSVTAADVNGDGKLNVRDLGLLQQYLNNWDVQFQPPAAG